MQYRLKVERITLERLETGDVLTTAADAPVERLLARAANGVRDVTTLVATVVLVATVLIPAMTPANTPTRPGATRYKITPATAHTPWLTNPRLTAGGFLPR